MSNKPLGSIARYVKSRLYQLGVRTLIKYTLDIAREVHTDHFEMSSMPLHGGFPITFKYLYEFLHQNEPERNQ